MVGTLACELSRLISQLITDGYDEKAGVTRLSGLIRLKFGTKTVASVHTL
jgi:hypothetical protein